MRRGVRLAALAFPQYSTDPWRPRARLSEDILGDIRSARYLSVGLDVVPGTSGGPILLQSGKVIGLVAGGNFDSHPSQTQPQTPNGGVNWGITVTALWELLTPPP